MRVVCLRLSALLRIVGSLSTGAFVWWNRCSCLSRMACFRCSEWHVERSSCVALWCVPRFMHGNDSPASARDVKIIDSIRGTRVLFLSAILSIYNNRMC